MRKSGHQRHTNVKMYLRIVYLIPLFAVFHSYVRRFYSPERKKWKLKSEQGERERGMKMGREQKKKLWPLFKWSRCLWIAAALQPFAKYFHFHCRWKICISNSKQQERATMNGINSIQYIKSEKITKRAFQIVAVFVHVLWFLQHLQFMR